MKKLETSKIAAGSKAPISDRSLAHLQEADRETIESTIKALIDESLDNSTAYANVVILHGAELTDNGSDIDINSGAVYYQGEIYRVDAQTATPITNNPAWKIATTYRTGDPVEFSDGVDKDFHAIEKMEIVDSSEGSTIENYSSSVRFLNVNAAQVETSIFDGVITESGGNIGINQGSPTEALDVGGNIKLTGNIIEGTNLLAIDNGASSAVLNSQVSIFLDIDDDNNGSGQFFIRSGGTNIFTVGNAGAVTITGNVDLNDNSITEIDSLVGTSGANFNIDSDVDIIINYDADDSGTGDFSIESGGIEVFNIANNGVEVQVRNAAVTSADSSGASVLSLGFNDHIAKTLEVRKLTTNTSETVIYCENGFNVDEEIATFANSEITFKRNLGFGNSTRIKDEGAGNIVVSSDVDVNIDYDAVGNGVGQLIFKRGGVTVASFNNAGDFDLSGNNIQDVNTVSNTGNIILNYDSGNSGSSSLFIRSGGSTVAVFDNAGALSMEGNNIDNVNTITSSTGARVTLTSDDSFEINVDAIGGGGGSFLVRNNGINKFAVASDIQAFARLRPSSDNVYDLGASTFAWSTIYYYNLSNVSDKRFKENIHHTELGLEFINKLNPVEYNFKGEEKVKLGFLAQEVQEIISSSFGIVNDKDPERLGLNYTELIAPLVKAVQELSARLDKLEN